MKLKQWLIKKLIGNTPVIMNVTLTLDDIILASEPNGIFDKCNINYSDRFLGGVQIDKTKNHNAQ